MKNKRFQRSFSGEARLAQLAEHYLDTVGVTSSSLVPRTSLRLKFTATAMMSGMAEEAVTGWNMPETKHL